MVDFHELLQQDVDDVKEIPPLPEGSYSGRITTFSYGETNNEKKTPYFRVNVQLESAEAGIDEDELAAATEQQKLSSLQFHRDFFLTPKALKMLADFLKSLGLKGSLEQTMEQISGLAVIAEVERRPTQDGQRFFNPPYLKSLVGKQD